jgi:hypothetical protein
MTCGRHEIQNIYEILYVSYGTHFVEDIVYIMTVQTDSNLGNLFGKYNLETD